MLHSVLYEVSWWSISSWLFLECWQLDISSKNIIISDTLLSLSHTCNNCVYLKQNYILKYCFASWYSFWPANDWIISAARFCSDWNWAIELWTWNIINHNSNNLSTNWSAALEHVLPEKNTFLRLHTFDLV